MQSINLGRKFLNCYNRKHKTNYTAKEFLDNIGYDLFYGIGDVAGKKSFVHIINSPFAYKTNSFAEAMSNFTNKIESGVRDMTICREFPAESDYQATASQVDRTWISALSDNDVYLGVIGDSLFVKVEGGYSVAIYDEEVLYDIFQGWIYYRKMLNDSTYDLKGNQCETWNGVWLVYYYDSKRKINEDSVINDIINGSISVPTEESIEKLKKKGRKEDRRARLKDVKWYTLFLLMSRVLNNTEININVKAFVKTNKSCGNIIVECDDLKYVHDFLSADFEVDNKKTTIIKIFNDWAPETFGSIIDKCYISKECFKPKDFDEIIRNLRNSKTITKPKISKIKKYIRMIQQTPELEKIIQDLSDYLSKFAKSNLRDRPRDIKDIVNSTDKSVFYKRISNITKKYDGLFDLKQLTAHILKYSSEDYKSVILPQLVINYYSNKK